MSAVPAFDCPSAMAVLVVCRSPQVLATLSAVLQGAGERVLTAGSIEDAWECVRMGGIGVVVQDLTACNVEDYLFLRTLRSTVGTNGIPVIGLTQAGLLLPELAPLGEESVKDTFLKVPCPGHQLVSMVRELRKVASIAPVPQLSEHEAGLPTPAVALPPVVDVPAPEANSKRSAVHESSAKLGLFAGQLGAIDVAKILGMLESLNLTGSLHMNEGKHDGQIFFVEGQVWHAKIADIEGPDALFLLFHLNKGEFRFEVGEAVQKRTIQGNSMQLLLEGMRQMDEAKRAIVEHQKRRKQTERLPKAAPGA